MLWTVGPSEVREVPGSLWMMQLQERRLEAGGVVRKPGSCPGTGEPGAQDCEWRARTGQTWGTREWWTTVTSWPWVG